MPIFPVGRNPRISCCGQGLFLGSAPYRGIRKSRHARCIVGIAWIVPAAKGRSSTLYSPVIRPLRVSPRLSSAKHARSGWMTPAVEPPRPGAAGTETIGTPHPAAHADLAKWSTPLRCSRIFDPEDSSRGARPWHLPLVRIDARGERPFLPADRFYGRSAVLPDSGSSTSRTARLRAASGT